MDALSHLLLAFVLGQAFQLDGNLQLILILSSVSLDLDGVSISREAASRSHRGPMHSILGALLVSTLISMGYTFFMRLQATALLSVIPISFAGLFSHLVLDLLTTGNMIALWPLSKRNFALNLTHYIDPVNLVALTMVALLTIYTGTDVATNRIVAAAAVAFLIASFGVRFYMKNAATDFIKRPDTNGASEILALPTLRPDRWWIIRKTPIQNGYRYGTHQIDCVHNRILRESTVENPYAGYSGLVEPPIDSPQKAVAHTQRDKRISESIERFVIPAVDVNSSRGGNTWQVFWYDAFARADRGKRQGILDSVRIDGTTSIIANRAH